MAQKPGMALVVFMLIVPALAAPALGQQSSNFNVKGSVFNAGGNPRSGSVLSSASFRITVDAIGDNVTPGMMSGPSFQIDGGVVLQFRRPEEVTGLLFLTNQAMMWNDAEKSVSPTYNLYRASVTTLPSLIYGSCEQQGLGSPTTTDADEPSPGDGYFYLATAENCIGLEGTKGFQGDGVTMRQGSVCP